MKAPRIVIAGTNSGCGKTTVTAGILAALVKRGLKVQPFKVGPDYIDPMFHTFVTGNASRNLDSWMLSEDIVQFLFNKNSADKDISIIEGVMGLYDGFGGNSDVGSTSHVARILKAPVILLVNGEGMSLSIAALIRGFMDFDRSVEIKGIIINNLKSEHHYLLLKEIIENKLGISVIGYLPKLAGISISSRHLGLVQSSEIEDLREKISILAEQVEKTLNLDLLIKLAQEVGEPCQSSLEFNIAKRNGSPTIAVARDKAFSFYYEDNLDLLKLLGAELVYFSPLEDSSLPEDLDGMYIGGGYPELWAKDLQDNISIRQEIKRHVGYGLPTYAECGGLMYLSESIELKNGEIFEMVGMIPGKSGMTDSLQRFGYVDIEVTSDNILSKKGYRIRAHEFHYSTTTVDWSTQTCFRALKRRAGKEALTWQCGYKMNNLLAGYPHLHFWSNTGFAERFINSCLQYKAGKR